MALLRNKLSSSSGKFCTFAVFRVLFLLLLTISKLGQANGSQWSTNTPRMNSIQQLFSLEGQTALVTGGTRGIGQAMAIALAEAGADILLVQVSVLLLVLQHDLLTSSKERPNQYPDKDVHRIPQSQSYNLHRRPLLSTIHIRPCSHHPR